jgi:exodeoxyribonuclease V alpha subunit
VVDTREQAVDLNAAVRDRLVADGRVDDTRVITTRAGQRIGAGDRITTRRNDPTLDVANRDSWTVTAVGPGAKLVVTPADEAPGPVTPARAAVTPDRVTVPFQQRGLAAQARGGERVLPAGYVASHVELAYATTAHGVQGDTVPAAHLLVGEHTGAAAAYVGMTRGRQANTAHLVATDVETAREQWIAVFARDRADLGPAHAALLAGAEAARYATGRPLDQVLADLHEAWTTEQYFVEWLAVWEPHCDTLRRVVASDADHAGELTQLETGYRRTAIAAEQARQRAEASARVVATHADHNRDALLAAWDGERDPARAAADVVLAGAGRLGLRRAAVTGARDQLAGWGDRWRPLLPHLPTDPRQLARVAHWFDDRPALWAALEAAGHRAACQHHPECTQERAAADAAASAHQHAVQALADARQRRHERLEPLGPIAWTGDLQKLLADLQHDLAATRQQLTDARARITALTAEPALRAQPGDRLVRERTAWAADGDATHAHAAARQAARPESSLRAALGLRPPDGAGSLSARGRDRGSAPDR